MSKVTICGNCLASFKNMPFTYGYPVGPEFGSQRDPDQHRVDLCPDCIAALEAGDFATLHDRYQSERSYSFGPNGEPSDD